MTLRKPNVNAEPVQVRSFLQVCQQRRNLYKYNFYLLMMDTTVLETCREI